MIKQAIKCMCCFYHKICDTKKVLKYISNALKVTIGNIQGECISNLITEIGYVGFNYSCFWLIVIFLETILSSCGRLTEGIVLHVKTQCK